MLQISNFDADPIEWQLIRGRPLIYEVLDCFAMTSRIAQFLSPKTKPPVWSLFMLLRIDVSLHIQWVTVEIKGSLVTITLIKALGHP